MKVTVDQDKCVGSGQCLLIAPDVFDQRDEDGIVVLRRHDVPAGSEDDVAEAAQVCPGLAISVED